MKHAVLWMICAVVIAGFLFAGCSGKESTDVKTMDEYCDEAAKKINAENAEVELDKITKEIEADTGK